MQIPPIWPRENSFVNKLTRHYLHRHPPPDTSQTLCCSVSGFLERLANFDGLLQKRKGRRGFSWHVRHCDSSPHYPSTASVQWCSLININTNSKSVSRAFDGRRSFRETHCTLLFSLASWAWFNFSHLFCSMHLVLEWKPWINQG